MQITNVISIIILFSGALSLVFVFSLLIKKRKSTSNILLAVLFLCWGISLIRGYLAVTGIAFEYPYLFFFHLPVVLSIAPLVYLNSLAMIDPDFKFSIGKCRHFIFPVLIMAVEFIPVSTTPVEYSNVVRSFLLTGFFNLDSQIIMKRILAGITIGSIYYILYEILIIRSIIKRHSIWKLNTKRRILFIVIYISIIPLALPQIIFLIGLLAGYRYYFLFAGSITSAVVLFAYFMVQRNAEIPDDLMLNIRRSSQGRSLLAGINIAETGRRLAELMEKEKAYFDETITLHSIAEKLGMTQHQLSEFINEHYKMNFNAFVNQYRVKEAMKMLTGEADLSVMEIAYSVGFNTKSAFNNAFRKFTRTTPYDYRRKNQSPSSHK